MPIDLPQPDASFPAGSFDMPMASDSPTSFSAGGAAPAEMPAQLVQRAHRSWVIGLAVASAGLVGFLAIVVLYQRSSRAEAYTNTIIVWGRDSWDGATVTVTGDNLPQGGFVAELTEKNHLICRFHVPGGDYEVRVQKGGRTLDFMKTRPPLTSHVIWWPFRAPPAATQPSL